MNQAVNTAEALRGAAPADAAEVLIERARALIPALKERSKRCNAERQLPRETVEDFRRLELARCLQPQMFGGFGSDYRVFSRLLRTLAQGCGSSAWVMAVHGEHAWVVAQFTEAAQHAVWDGNPHAVASAVFAPSGTAEPTPGGYRYSGRWSFASGCDSAQWALLMAMVKRDGAPPEQRMALIPIEQVEIIDDWDVIGLCGTGSKSIVVKDVLVPAERTVTMHELKTGTAPGAAVHADNPMMRTPRSLTALFSLSSVVVGLAERAVNELIEFNRERRSRGIKVADIEAVQLMVSEAAAKSEAAALVGESTIDRTTALMASGEAITAEQVAWGRRNAAYSAQLAHEAGRLIFEVGGGTALQASSPLQTIFRDITAASAHLSLTWHRAAPFYGQIKLGVPVAFDTI